MIRNKTLGLILMLLGAVMLLSTNVLWATVGVDTVAPSIMSNTPFDKSVGAVPTSFISNQKYSVRVVDSGSGVSSVTYSDSVTQNYIPQTITLTRISGTSNDGVWDEAFPSGAFYAYAVGVDYTFAFIATDVAGNSKTVSGIFRIYDALVGDWYVNDQKIISPTQTIWLKTNNVKFKFVKTQGVPDAQVTCTLTGGVTGTLSLVSAKTWEVSKTMSDGSYSVTMKAYDGTTSISMSIYELEIGDTTPITTDSLTENLKCLFGFGMLGLGFIVYIRARKQPQ